jgi:hypothetical protein
LVESVGLEYFSILLLYEGVWVIWGVSNLLGRSTASPLVSCSVLKYPSSRCSIDFGLLRDYFFGLKTS